MAPETILSTRGLTKGFAGFIAVSNVDLDVVAGTIHGVIGPNGAGKTTFFNLLTKFLKPTGGQIIFRGNDITKLGPDAVARIGIARSFQISSIFPALTPLQNVRLGLQSRGHPPYDFFRSSRVLDGMNQRARELLDSVGVLDRNVPAADLSYGNRRALELAMSLSLDPQLLLLDEPMAGLGREDIKRITALIGGLRDSCTILMVEHNLSVVAELCDTITVFQSGAKLAEGSYETVASDARVIAAYMGHGRRGADS